MPVQNAGTFAPVADVKFDASNKPETVGADHSQKSTGFYEVEIGDVTEDHTAIHSQESTNLFPNPEPYTVALDGFGPDAKSTSKKATEVTPKEPLAETKVVRAPKKAAPKGTDGAEGK